MTLRAVRTGIFFAVVVLGAVAVTHAGDSEYSRYKYNTYSPKGSAEDESDLSWWDRLVGTTPEEKARKLEREQIEERLEKAEKRRKEAERQRKEAEEKISQEAEARHLELERDRKEAAERREQAEEEARREAKLKEKERKAAERAELERLDAERKILEKAERERLAVRQAERERIEKERLAAEKAERERIEKERKAADKAERDRLVAEEAERERIEKQRLAAEKAERDRLEKERMAREQADLERLAAEEAERELVEKERKAAEKADLERLAVEKTERERLDQERKAREQAEWERERKEIEAMKVADAAKGRTAAAAEVKEEGVARKRVEPSAAAPSKRAPKTTPETKPAKSNEPAIRFVRPESERKDAAAVAAPAQTEAPKLVSRFHLRINKKETEQEFLKLSMGRKSTMQEMAVTERLLKEKEMEASKINETLAKMFSITPNGNYQYDTDTMTIYEVVADSAGKQSKRLHARIPDKAKATQFVNLVSAKGTVVDAIRSIKLLIKEKQMEMTNIENLLAQKFSVSKDRTYRYDPETMSLYELVPVPEGFQTPKN